MEYGVIKPYIDRDTFAEYAVGDIVTYGDPERAKELIERGYITELSSETTPEEKAPELSPETAPEKKAKEPAKRSTKKKA